MTRRISMWSGPRNISTSMMRAFENRDDTIVHDEPFYACYLRESGAPHPMRDETLKAMTSDWDRVLADLSGPQSAAYSFEKHIAFHFAARDPVDVIGDARAILLIRDPRAMVASYKNKYENVAPIIDSFRIEREIFDRLQSQARPCPIIDAADVLKAPEAMLRALCNSLEIPFSERMLTWPAGPRQTDGPWASHWYDAVNASTGFKPYAGAHVDLTPELEDAANACSEDYAFLHGRRLRGDG